jgi:ABC-type transport system involved in Fe-S cluster assembly fused permease/ATPase subunit
MYFLLASMCRLILILGVPWLQVFVYVVCRWLQKNLGSLRSALWIPMSDYSYMELSTAAFAHVHTLSLEFHLDKKTGELLSALNNGLIVTMFLEQVVFQFIPTLFDLVIAIGFFLANFDAYYTLVVGVSSYTYFSVTIRMAQWRVESNQKMIDASRNEQAVK